MNQNFLFLARLSFLLVFLLLHLNNFAQKTYKHNSPGSDCYSAIYVYDSPEVHTLGTLILSVDQQTDLSGSHQHELILSGLFKQYTFVFIQVLNAGFTNEQECLSTIITSFSDAKKWSQESVFYLKKSDTTQFISSPDGNNRFYQIEVAEDSAGELSNLLTELEKRTDQHVQHFAPHAKQEINRHTKNTAIETFLGINDLSYAGFGLDKNRITSCGLNFSKRIFNSFSLETSLGFSLNKPGKNELKAEAKSQVMSSIENGDSVAHILLNVNGHLMFFGEVLMNYSFNNHQPLKPYVSMGIGCMWLNKYNAFYQDSLDVSGGVGGLINNPGALSGKNGTTITKVKDQYFFIALEPGLELRLSSRIMFDAKIPFKVYAVNNAPILSWGATIGVGLTLNPR